MTKDDWLHILNTEKDRFKVVLAYCLYKGKPEQETMNMLQFVSLGILSSYGITISSLTEEAVRSICMEFDFIELRNKEGILIKFYKNQQTNGKEILKI